MRCLAFISFFACALVLDACAATTGTLPPGGGGSGAGGGAAGTGAASGGGNNAGGAGNNGSGGGVSVGGSSGTAGGSSGPQYLYANTDKTLFKLDPSNFALSQIGNFDCIGYSGQDTAMTDLAVDKSGKLWGISVTAVHPLSIQGGTVHCGQPIQLNNPKNVKFYGLTFAPAGVLAPNKEVLVASNSAGQLWEIDQNGNLSQHGTFGTVPKSDGNGHYYQNAGKPWELSGDIVFLANNGSPIGFATVRDCPNPPSTSGCNTTDTLLQINVPALKTATTGSVTKAVRGEIVPAKGCSAPGGSFGSFYGIAALKNKVYGFARSGDIVSVNTNDGTACLVQSYSNDKWAGAGVTTIAPVTPPSIK